MAVPFIDLSRFSREIAPAVEADWHACLERCAFVGGPLVAQLEAALVQHLGAPHALCCANGTDALTVAMQAMGVRPGMKVAVPNLTFWATYEAVAQLGAVPVLIDVDAADCQLDFHAFCQAHEDLHLDAAVLVHLFGWASHRLADFRRYCREHNIRLLEDGAQAFGVEVDGAPVLAGAEVGTLSFYPAKVVGGAMDGGALTFASADTASIARSLCNHGRADHYSYAHLGWNSRMGGLQAAYLLRTLERLPAILASRRAAVAWYRDRFAGHGSIRVWGPPAGVQENGYLCVVTVEGFAGAELERRLKQAGIGCARTYPETMDSQPPAHGALRFGSLTVSQRFCESVVNLPVFYGILPEELEQAAAALEQAVG